EYLKAQHLEYDPEVFPHPSFFSPNDLAVIIDSTVHHHLPLTVVHDVVSEEGIATFQITSQGVDYFTPMTPEEILVEVNRRLRPELNNFQCFDLEDLAMEINNKYFSFAFRRFSE
ncbi:hypothetical protein HYX12_04730, partial [Candidatus Woesearchaeota archaeon]|nr:hypothetical protein [Candidatus Woesearchaeota archaeon]